MLVGRVHRPFHERTVFNGEENELDEKNGTYDDLEWSNL